MSKKLNLANLGKNQVKQSDLQARGGMNCPCYCFCCCIDENSYTPSRGDHGMEYKGNDFRNPEIDPSYLY